ncbi:hypothetical protein CYMTET_13891 [Cymbomonas tetramitiformis]|uniref:Uncharacterized protein n=1 Tax=Cymbomonas tetramitiformis TaxID=36881 RepID=A0AAE0GHH5_9CHLO|nr:hypothetical protein CYMTET_13891 [Cymbomonas tetramitiformis]
MQGELLVFIDYKEDKEHMAGYELTCEGGGAKKRGVTQGQCMEVLDGHMYISFLDCKKDADTLAFVVRNIVVEFFRGKGV